MERDELREQLDDIQRRFPALKPDDLFVCWFLRAYVADDEASAAAAITGGPRDKSVDAVLVDHKARTVFVVQGKYREKVSKKNEARPDVIAFAALAEPLCDADGQKFRSLSKKAMPDVAKRLSEARRQIIDNGYNLRMYYVTLGSVSAELIEEASDEVSCAALGATLEILDGARVMHVLRDYLDGVAPPIPNLDLEIEQHANVKVSGVLNRFDSVNKIETWVFSMRGDKVAEMFEFADVRLYARNIRGFLGKTAVNDGMARTLSRESDHFFYYNNGITIICDAAVKRSRGGVESVRVSNPQIINGQQTSRALALNKEKAAGASVLVKVMQVPRSPGAKSGDTFDELVTRIVANTNWQNSIDYADLRSNDRVQIEIERALRKLGYCYLRKRQNKSEARASAGKIYRLVTKADVAKAVAACELDPLIVRQGASRLFGEHYEHLFGRMQSADFYLCRYWMLRLVSKASRGNPGRGYAKWLALHFVWSRIASILKSDDDFMRLRRGAELGQDPLASALATLVELVFEEVMSFYKANKGRGAKELDPSRFFKVKGRHTEFREFWKQRSAQKRVDAVLAELREALAEL